MNQEIFNKLLEKYQNNTATEVERRIIDDWLENLSDSENRYNWTDCELDKLYQSVKPKSKMVRLRYWLSTAAAMLLLSIGIYYYLQKASVVTYKEIALENVMPSDEIAKLVLENGQVIYLDDQKEGLSINEHGIKYDDGTRLYDSNAEVVILSIHIPKGKKYRIELSDGTKVWLNASTILKYPSRFTGAKREVELDGEAFFEVAPLYVNENNTQKRISFEVKTRNQTIKVLGTHFNVSSYKNAFIEKTTLLEGSVDVLNNAGNSKILRPGQQSIVSPNNQHIYVANADMESTISWKNDLFIFRNASLQEIMQELERWYDITVDIDKYPNTKFYGEMNRSVPLSEVLEIIYLASDIKFKLISDGKERRLMMQ